MEGLLHDPDSQFAMICCSLAKEFDRVAYLRYYLTKALYEDDSMTVGSIVMNTVNEYIGIKAFESCFEAAQLIFTWHLQELQLVRVSVAAPLPSLKVK